MIEYAIQNSGTAETPEAENRYKNMYSDTRGVVGLLLGDTAHMRYLLNHYDENSLRIIFDTLEAVKDINFDNPSQDPREYRKLNKSVYYNPIPQPMERRSRTDNDLIDRIINTPTIQIIKAFRALNL